MNNFSAHIEDLIAKHFAKETSDAEEKLIADWLKESDTNLNHFQILKKVYDATESVSQNVGVDTDAAWLKLKSKINRQQKTANTKVKSISIHRFLKIAAAIVLVGGILVELFKVLYKTPEPILVSSGSKTKEVILPDSSVVFLNTNSSIVYSFTKKERLVKITGEAFFDVVHNNEKPFIVITGDLAIQDIGTSFNINAKVSDSTEVIVKTGEVTISLPASNPVHVFQNERSVYHKQEKRIIKTPDNDVNALAYKTKIFVFENASLPAVFQTLNEVYETHIQISDSLKYCHLTATFKNEKIETVLQIITETLQLQVKDSGSQTILEGAGCEK